MALMAYGPDATAHQVPVSDGASGWTMQKVTSAEIDAAAAIAYSQLSLSAGDIPYSMLTLTGGVVNADVATAAAIALSKLADPGSGKVVGSTGSGALAVVPPGTELDYAQITSNGTSITGNSITYDGTSIIIQVYASEMDASASNTQTVSVTEDGTSIGIIAAVSAQNSSIIDGAPVAGFLKHTPSAGAHTYSVTATSSMYAGAGGAGVRSPAFIRVTKA